MNGSGTDRQIFEKKKKKKCPTYAEQRQLFWRVPLEDNSMEMSPTSS